MKKDNKLLIIILSIITIVLAVLLVYYFNMSKESFGFGKNNSNGGGLNKVGNTQANNNSSNNTTYNVDPDEEIPTGVVTDYTEYFNVNNIINNYYNLITNETYNSVVNILDKDFKDTNKITKDNVMSFVNTKYDNITYFSKNMYRKGRGGVRYYFVSGEAQRYLFAEEKLDEIEEVCFLVIIDYNNGVYSLNPIDKGTDLPSYASSYNIKKNKQMEKTTDNTYSENRYTEEMITTYYIAYFKNLLYLNSEKAYNMLNDQTKSLYPELKDFSNNLENIYNNVTTSFISYSVSGENTSRTYAANLTNDKKITMKESSIMNFKVDIK